MSLNSKIPIIECNEPLVAINPNEFVIKPVYYEKGFSDTSFILIRSGVLKQLKQAQVYLQSIKKGWEIKVFDGFRSLRTQKNIYNNFYTKLRMEHPDWTSDKVKQRASEFVSFPTKNPKCPPPHNTGGAIDLTLVDANTHDVPMGTDFDDFSKKSHTSYFKNNKYAKCYHENRMLLVEILKSVRLLNDSLEWWHFSFGTQEWAEKVNAERAVYSSAEALSNPNP